MEKLHEDAATHIFGARRYGNPAHAELGWKEALTANGRFEACKVYPRAGSQVECLYSES